MKLDLLLFLISTSLFGQIQKKEYILDEDDKIIMQSEFEKKLGEYVDNATKYSYVIINTDSTITAKLVTRISTGNISKAKRDDLAAHLGKTTGKKVSSNQTLLVYFFYPDYDKSSGMMNELCIRNYVNNNKIKRLSKEKEIAHATFTAKDYKFGGGKTFEDASDYIKQNFFMHGSHCGNYIIVRPDGSYYKMYGEHHKDKMLDKLKNGW